MWIKGLMQTTDTSFLPIQQILIANAHTHALDDCQLCSVINLSVLRVKKIDDAYVLLCFFSILFK